MQGRSWATRSRWVMLVVVHALVFALFTGCRRPPDSAGSGRAFPVGGIIGVIGPSDSDASWPGIRGGAERYHVQSPHIDCLAVTPADDSPQALLAAAEQVCNRKPVAICLCVNDPRGAVPAARRIVAQHIVLVTIGLPVHGVTANGIVEIGWPEAAGILGRNLDVVARGRKSYSLLHEKGRDALSTECYDQFIVAAASRTSMTMLAERDIATASKPAYQLVQEMLQAYRHTGLIVTLTPQVWLSERPRLKLPDLNRFATLGAAPPLWGRLRSGEAVALVGPLDGDVGYAAVDMAVRKAMEIPEALSRRVIPCELVTPQTLPAFARRYAAAANLRVSDLMPPETPDWTAPTAGGRGP
jgi:ABC-type sugar transport system substrate-binding protein